MKEIDMRDTSSEVERVTGVYVTFPKEFEEAGLKARDMIVWSIVQLATRAGGEDMKLEEPLLRITMPCGETYEYRTSDELPEDSVPCRCGDPNHRPIWIERQPRQVLRAAGP